MYIIQHTPQDKMKHLLVSLPTQNFPADSKIVIDIFVLLFSKYFAVLIDYYIQTGLVPLNPIHFHCFKQSVLQNKLDWQQIGSF